jgi:hypothetical protein
VGQLAEINDKLSESDLPFLIDILDWHNISEDFRKRITEDAVAL